MFCAVNQVTTINDNLATKTGTVTYSSGYSDYGSGYVSSLKKSGNVVTLVIHCLKSSPFDIDTPVEIMTLSEGFRPPDNISFVGESVAYTVSTSGVVYATPKTGITTLVTGAVSYIV